MKWTLLSLLILAAACETVNYGFKNNPAAITVKAHESLQANNLKDLKANLAKHALCLWGNEQGLELLKKNLPKDINKLMADIQLTESVALKTPRFVGYWAHHKDTYYTQLIDRDSRILLGEAKIECHFGVPEIKRESDANKPKLDYPERNCKIAVIKARSFENLRPKKDCLTFSDQL